MKGVTYTHGSLIYTFQQSQILFWLKKKYVIVKNVLSFREFIYALHPEISSFFRQEFPLFILIFVK